MIDSFRWRNTFERDGLKKERTTYAAGHTGWVDGQRESGWKLKTMSNDRVINETTPVPSRIIENMIYS